MESLGNIAIVCKECSPKKRAYDGDPSQLVGKYVKVGFRTDDDSMANIEHMWVEVMSWDGELLHGRLGNSPLFLSRIQFGDDVSVQISDIEDVC